MSQESPYHRTPVTKMLTENGLFFQPVPEKLILHFALILILFLSADSIKDCASTASRKCRKSGKVAVNLILYSLKCGTLTS